MAPSTIRKAIGAVKDQTSIGIAKVGSNMAPELEVAIVKATSHDDDPASEKYIREILHLTSSSRGYVTACVSSISKRLGKTRDWIVAIKCLMLIHRLLNDGDPVFHQEIMYATRRGTRLLNLSDFRDEAHSNSWDHSAFVRTYALYLDQRLEMMVFERKQNGGGGEIERYGSREERWRSPPASNNRGYDYGEFGDEPAYGMRKSRSSGDVRESTVQDQKDVTPLRQMEPERIFGKMSHLQRLLDRFLSCRPTGLAKNERMVLVTLYPMVKESFQLYADICEVLAILLDKFFDMEYEDCVKAFDAYASASKQIDELVGFYNWCKDIGIARSSEYPEVQRITSKLLDTLEEFVRDRAKATKSPERKVEALPAPPEEPAPDMNEIKALPPPEDYTTPPPPEPESPKPAAVVQETGDLMDLREEGVTADDQGNKFALALFAGPGTNNGSWEAFSSNGGPEVTSAWQNPAAESGKADWELALVETASHLSQQKAAMGGGLDPLLLNGMYDQGMVRQHVATAQSSGGSASSVALPGLGKSSTPVLALPAPDGTVQTVGLDPFAASLTVPPPSYVQMADLDPKPSSKMATILTLNPLAIRLFSSNSQRYSCYLHRTMRIGQAGIHFQTNYPVSFMGFLQFSKRRNFICAVSKDAEESFKKTVEVDRLIDTLREASDKELPQIVVENVLAFNESFWIRVAARADTCKSDDDKKDYEELALTVMSIVDRLVHKTNEKIEASTDVLKAILKPVIDEVEEISWPLRDPEALSLMEKEINQREQEGQLDEGFLAEVNAQLRQATKDGDKPGLEAMLQKVLQLYASTVLSKRSYAKKGNEVLKAEQFLETIIKAPEEVWNKLLLDGMTLGKGDISPEELYTVIKKRMERTLIRTEGGSYQQRVLIEYLKGIESRAGEIVRVLQG